MKIRKNRGPSLDPCGTPSKIKFDLEEELPILVFLCLLLK